MLHRKTTSVGTTTCSNATQNQKIKKLAAIETLFRGGCASLIRVLSTGVQWWFSQNPDKKLSLECRPTQLDPMAFAACSNLFSCHLWSVESVTWQATVWQKSAAESNCLRFKSWASEAVDFDERWNSQRKPCFLRVGKCHCLDHSGRSFSSLCNTVHTGSTHTSLFEKTEPLNGVKLQFIRRHWWRKLRFNHFSEWLSLRLLLRWQDECALKFCHKL